MTETSREYVELSVEGAVAAVWLSRPDRLNALSPPLVEELCGAIDEASRKDCSVLLLAGRGRAFCSGYDLKHVSPPLSAGGERMMLERVQDLTRLVRKFPGAVVSAVHGYAIGAGCELALSADLVLAADDAVFSLPEVGLGLGVTGGISHILPRLVGLMRAKEILFLGERLGAVEAHRLGMVNRVLPGDGLMQGARDLCVELASRPQLALVLAKIALDQGSQVDLETSLRVEVTHCTQLHQSESKATPG